MKGAGDPDGTMEKEAVVFPTSFAQQRLWFLDRLEPGNPIYNIAQAFRLSGPLQRTALEQSLNEIARRHEILRTAFIEIEGEPAQIIGSPRDQPLRVKSLSRIPADQRDGEALRLIEEEAHRPFDLTKRPLFRATLFELSGEEHTLLLTMHHIVSDGWSMGVLYRELSSLYEAFCRREVPALPELPLQYVDYAVWQRQWLRGQVLERQLSYWKQQLDGAPHSLELPTDRPRHAAQNSRGARKYAAFTKALCDELKALGRREEVTLFMTLLAAFQTLLHRYTGEDDIVVGSPIAGRNRLELEELIGLFINTLILRGDLSGDPKFTELLARARKTALEAYEHQDLPLQKLVEELNPDRDPSRSPLFQVMFALQNAPRDAPELAGLKVSPLEVEIRTAKFDLTLSMEEAAGSLKAALEYDTDLFEHDTISRMLGHFETLLQGIAANPERRLSELPILTEAELRRLLVEWNDTKRDYPRDKCIHELFEEQAEKTPDAVAVVFPSTGSGRSEDKQLTYRALNRRANQLAHHLQKLGVEPEARVGIYMERSLEMIVALLGILKAGGVYVPLDPDYPEERLTFMLHDSQAKLLLTQHRFLDKLPEWRGEIVCVDPDWQQFSRKPEHNPVSRATAENLAYVIYTSGSTGTPKGVATPHRAITRLVSNTDYVSVKPDDVVSQLSNCSFDAATFEIWGALLNGARLVGLRTDVALSPRDLAAQIERRRISVMFLTTALLNLAAREFPTAFKSVRDLLFGGEAVDPKSVAEILQHGPPRRLLHVYGPTEATTFASWHVVNSVGEGVPTIPIGRPIANTQIYLLDPHLQPVPIGVAGELHIGGDGLASGYLNHPELTAEKFISNPFSDDPKARLYKSGDLVRYLPDGNIEFLGRIDRQVKIHGFRIEPGEIETVLAQNPAVRQAVVLAHENSPAGPSTSIRTGKQLVAYIVPSKEQAPTTDELRGFLKKQLPDYMLPSRFVFLESLPLTPNGKVDRRALPPPGRARPENNPGYVAPSETVEYQLAQIWEELLGVRPIGIQDDFFDLGGHSLLAVRMMHRIEEACGERLPLATLLAGPTIQYLAQALVKRRVKEETSLLVKVQSGGAKRPFFFLHGDWNGGGFYCLKLARGLGEDQPFYALIPHGLSGSSVPETIEAMAASYIQMVRAVQPEGPYLLGGMCNGGVIAYEMARQLEQHGQRVNLVVSVASRARTTLARRMLHGLVSALGYLLGLEPEKEHDLFLCFRGWAHRVRGVYRHCLHRLNLGAQLPNGKQAPPSFQKINSAAAHAPGEPGEAAAGFNPTVFNRNNHGRNINELYNQAMGGHIPKPYSGRLVVLWPIEERFSIRRDPTVGWGRIASRLEIQTIPGGHITCVTEHLDILADRMKTHLGTTRGATT